VAPSGDGAARGPPAKEVGVILLAALGCGGSPGEDGLFGTEPGDARAAPTFRATADDGTPRDRDDLLGHPTVMWFYPAAATGG
jgi:hypothetical protein